MVELGESVIGYQEEEFRDALEAKLSHLCKVPTDFRDLSIWKGKKKPTGENVYVIKHEPSRIVTFAYKDEITSLESFCFGFCTASEAFGTAICLMKEKADEREVH